jgi:hypothetical protein
MNRSVDYQVLASDLSWWKQSFASIRQKGGGLYRPKTGGRHLGLARQMLRAGLPMLASLPRRHPTHRRQKNQMIANRNRVFGPRYFVCQALGQIGEATDVDNCKFDWSIHSGLAYLRLGEQRAVITPRCIAERQLRRPQHPVWVGTWAAGGQFLPVTIMK